MQFQPRGIEFCCRLAGLAGLLDLIGKCWVDDDPEAAPFGSFECGLKHSARNLEISDQDGRCWSVVDCLDDFFDSGSLPVHIRVGD
ncbi:hypothetical protein ACVDG5_015925 [Mesorhizobium sp. ORM6]